MPTFDIGRNGVKFRYILPIYLVLVYTQDIFTLIVQWLYMLVTKEKNKNVNADIKKTF